MSAKLPIIYLARHGQTAWSKSGQHTGLTDIPLLLEGEYDAERLGARLQKLEFAAVWTSPLVRASRTCELAGFGGVATVDRDLVEWDYGEYEGLKNAEIVARQPGWRIYRDGCPGGESTEQVAARADRVLERARAAGGNVLLFSSGHFTRMLGARWIGLPPQHAELFTLATASLSALGYEHNVNEPVIQLWNDVSHYEE
ncbi:histidine phosphatase family protein [Lacipirellula parvula]|uniref:Fructose-1,6-bisphosphatase n=1 Tax=Lacipirellula parvula TaxID=2650471 RepID=A0A5K7XID0_9BACT|nr:histidine phosphatase family protein [Lacipirellula parvula]BBO35737.1 fructose-1,6-bisphosphatase [Lacipirellula parvula]